MRLVSHYDKSRVARQFGRAAVGYAEHDHLQRQVLAQLLPYLRPQPGLLVDVGCGPAHHFQRLCQVSNHYIGIDLAPAMLAQAAQHLPPAQLMLADMEQLPLADGSVHSLFSNLAMQWGNDLSGLLAEWYRVLAPGGQLAASTVLAGSLWPLSECFTAVDGQPHTNRWYGFDEFALLAGRLPWQVECQELVITQEFATVAAMLRELKGVGANYTAREQQGLFSRTRMQRLYQALERHRNARGLLELQWRIGLVTGRKELEEN
ncbi:methyltransferase domain-containing protein [Pseudidiomarina insulisalsae]|uniref:Methyltransferase type 11 domain-containing protein n=1 Tax=Pseudidiomarina insulisalsae TaxID=575789 RepID=A0A432YHE9_9GAMM|nr:methyltransferase domain-containing protein [Pseudidiomarina insulisalsae]RUO60340.1 hypothetical protein CWI71_08025 [Pseudidiomarina insulisalsae]